MLSTQTEVEQYHLTDIISRDITDKENHMLGLEPTELEVKDVVFSIPKQSSSRSDGFRSEFYTSCWKVIKDGVVEAARDFFKGSALSRFYSFSFIVLIPKVFDLTSFDKFRPISLYSVAYKNFSKIIISHLTRVIYNLFSHEQDAFFSRINIFENITLT